MRERLDKVRERAKERRRIFWKLDRMGDEVESIRDVSYRVLNQESIKSSGDISNPTQDKAMKIVDKYTEKMNKLYQQLVMLDEEIEGVIIDIEKAYKSGSININEVNVIKYYYIEGMSLDEITLAMHYSMEWVQKLKARALSKM